MQTPGRFKEHDITKQCHLRAFDASTSVISFFLFCTCNYALPARSTIPTFGLHDHRLRVKNRITSSD